MGRIHQFPNWASNPYINMLTQIVIAEGWELEGSLTAAELISALQLLRKGDVVHIQWTQPIVQDMSDRTRAKDSLNAFKQAIVRASRDGIAIVWTIHNLLPHSAKYVDLEIQLCEFLAQVADTIVQLTPITADAAHSLYELPPSKLVTLRHASYIGVYGEAPAPRDARVELGIPLSSPVVGFVGQIRYYKGVTLLLKAIEILSRRIDDLTLVLAGKTSPSEVEALERELPRSVRAVRRHGFVPDEDLGVWFSACDVMAFPYRNILNSGSVLLAATYGVPVVVPAEPAFVDSYASEAWVGLYSTEGEQEANLASEISEMLTISAEVGGNARKYAEEYTPLNMSTDYATLIARTVAARRSAAS